MREGLTCRRWGEKDKEQNPTPAGVAGQDGGRKLSCIDVINTTIYY